MSRTVTINYAQAIKTDHRVDPTTLSDTITVAYVVGYKAPSGSVTLFNQLGFPGPANQTMVTYTSPATESRATAFGNVQALIAQNEGLNLTAGDTVLLA